MTSVLPRSLELKYSSVNKNKFHTCAVRGESAPSLEEDESARKHLIKIWYLSLTLQWACHQQDATGGAQITFKVFLRLCCCMFVLTRVQILCWHHAVGKHGRPSRLWTSAAWRRLHRGYRLHHGLAGKNLKKEAAQRRENHIWKRLCCPLGSAAGWRSRRETSPVQRGRPHYLQDCTCSGNIRVTECNITSSYLQHSKQEQLENNQRIRKQQTRRIPQNKHKLL